MIKQIVLFFILISSISCSKKENVETQILDCLAWKIEEVYFGKSEDFFIYLKEMESFTIKNEFLASSTMESYLSFFENLNVQESHAKKVSDGIEELVSNPFNFNIGFVYGSYKACHIGLDISNNESIKMINSKLKIFDTLESTGFDDYESFVFLIKNTNFQNEKDRLMLFSLIQIFAYNKSQS